jgi:hypothetical protein
MRSVKRRGGAGTLHGKTVSIRKNPLKILKNIQYINSSKVKMDFPQPLELPTVKYASIRRLPTTEISSASLIEPVRPQSVANPVKISNTRKHGILRTSGSRNIFKSMKNRQVLKEKLKEIYGDQSENVYQYWINMKNSLWQNVRNKESNRRRLSGSSNFNTATNIKNSNVELYKAMRNIYGKNFAEFEDYITRSRNVGIQFPFHVKNNYRKNP